MSCGAITLLSNDDDVIGYHSSEDRKSVYDLSLMISIVGTVNKVYKPQIVTHGKRDAGKTFGAMT